MISMSLHIQDKCLIWAMSAIVAICNNLIGQICLFWAETSETSSLVWKNKWLKFILSNYALTGFYAKGRYSPGPVWVIVGHNGYICLSTFSCSKKVRVQEKVDILNLVAFLPKLLLI